MLQAALVLYSRAMAQGVQLSAGPPVLVRRATFVFLLLHNKSFARWLCSVAWSLTLADM
jgi:hypothetical protein